MKHTYYTLPLLALAGAALLGAAPARAQSGDTLVVQWQDGNGDAHHGQDI